MEIDHSAELLARTRLFAGIDPAIVRQLAELSIQRSYKKGQIIFHEGDHDDALFVIVAGSVRVYLTSEQGDEMTLVTLQPQDTFGELALIDRGPRSASTEAVEDTTVLVLRRPPLLEIFHDQPAVMDALLRSLGRSLRRLTEQAADLVFLDLNGRTAKLLTGLAKQRGRQKEEGLVLDLKLTQTDIATMVGGSRQSVNQILHHFEGCGYLELQRQRIVIKRLDLLARRAGIHEP